MPDTVSKERLRPLVKKLKKDPVTVAAIEKHYARSTTKGPEVPRPQKKNVKFGLSIVIPVYNEGPIFDTMLRKLIQSTTIAEMHTLFSRVQLCIVDDGSKASVRDRIVSAKNALRVKGLDIDRYCEITFYRFERNQGKGAAVRKGVSLSVGEYVWLMDADASITMRSFLDAHTRLISDMGADIAIGNRRHAKSSVSGYTRERLIASKAYNMLVDKMFKLGVDDAQCPCKVLPGAHARSIFSEMVTDGFAYDVELLARAKRKGLLIVDVPVVYKHETTSSVKIVTHGLRMHKELKHIRKVLR